MSENIQLAYIQSNVADYIKVRNAFMEHFPLFWKLGPVNYAGLTLYTNTQPEAEEIVTFYLCGMAMERLTNYSENDKSQEDIWHPIFAWSLVEGELAHIRPLKRLTKPASIEVEVKAPGRRKRSN